MPVGDSGGFFLSLVTESFAVRALLGSLAAAVLAGVAVSLGLVRSRRARRLVVLAPVMTAAVAAVASFGEAYLPQLWVTQGSSGAAGQLVDLLGDLRVVATDSRVDLLVMAYACIVGCLLARRVVGALVVRGHLRRASDPVGYGGVVAVVQRLSSQLGVSTPRLALLARCPGGAFTVGPLRPVIAVDPELLHRLDERELEGLLAHELAHIRRGDTQLGLLVGVFRDLAFFLPALHVAARWLRREQEESADELASHHTGRPVALASSILKVWDASHDRRSLPMACAATPNLRLATAGGGSVTAGPSEAVRALTARVERLIERAPAITAGRRRVETALAAVIMTSATMAALVVPSWLHTGYDTYSLSFGYLAPPASPSAESPAFATFRHLAPEPEALAPEVPDRVAAGVAASVPEGATPDRIAAETTRDSMLSHTDPGCLCVESQAELRAGVAEQRATSPQMLWRDTDRPAWEVDHLADNRGVRPARPLWTLSDTGPQVGFFVFGSASS